MDPDLVVVGAGAAGLMAAITAAETRPGIRVACLDGAARVGAKILVSGGGRCNVTNEVVRAEDFNTGSRPLLRRVLAAFPVERTISFFESAGVPLKAEPGGKLFPAGDDAHAVLDALLRRAARAGVAIHTRHRVTAIRPAPGGFAIEGSGATLRALRVVVATGGRSLPRTGSDGAGFEIARSLGHSVVEPVPALAPLVLDGTFHAGLAGVSQPVELALRIDGRAAARSRGSMLWTHFGASGPAAMDLSRHWERARAGGRRVEVRASFLPGESFEGVERRFRREAEAHPTRAIHRTVAGWVPQRVAERLSEAAGIPRDATWAHLGREERRRLARALTEWPLPVVRTRGWNHAEATAGGVPLREIDAATMESRIVPGLHLAGEILDVDGRIGGFNFQWAWSSGHVAGIGAARALEAARAA